MTVAYVFPLIHRLDDEEPSCLEWWHTFISSQHLLCLGGCSFMSSAFMLFADQSYIGPRDDSCFLKRRQGSSVFRPDQRQKLASVRFWTRKQHNVSSSRWKSTLRGRFGIKYLPLIELVSQMKGRMVFSWASSGFMKPLPLFLLKPGERRKNKVGGGKILNYVTEPAPLVRRRKAPWPQAHEEEKEQHALQQLCQILDHLRLHIRWYNLKSRYQES